MKENVSLSLPLSLFLPLKRRNTEYPGGRGDGEGVGGARGAGGSRGGFVLSFREGKKRS